MNLLFEESEYEKEFENQNRNLEKYICQNCGCEDCKCYMIKNELKN